MCAGQFREAPLVEGRIAQAHGALAFIVGVAVGQAAEGIDEGVRLQRAVAIGFPGGRCGHRPEDAGVVPGIDRQPVVPVAHEESAGLCIEIQAQFAGLQHVAVLAAEHGQQHAALQARGGGLPLDVEETGMGGGPPVFHDVVPPGIGGIDHAHVVGHDIQQAAEAVRQQGIAQRGMAGLVADFRVQLRGIDHVVAVRAARGGLEVGRAVEMADAQCVQVGHGGGHVREGVVLVELYAVGRKRHIRGVERGKVFHGGLHGGASPVRAHGRGHGGEAGVRGQPVQRHGQAPAPVGLHVLGGAGHVDLFEPVRSHPRFAPPLASRACVRGRHAPRP